MDGCVRGCMYVCMYVCMYECIRESQEASEASPMQGGFKAKGGKLIIASCALLPTQYNAAMQ